MRQYFATLDAEEMVKVAHEKMKDWSQYLEASGLKRRFMQSYRLYFGKHFTDAETQQDSGIVDLGEQGEIKGVAVNHYRSIVKGILGMTTGQKPAWQARAKNSDLKSIQQTKTGNQILDSYMIGQRLLRFYKRSAENALVFGKGFTYTTWDKQKGRPYIVESYVDPMTGEKKDRTVYEGDIKVRSLSIFDHYCDPNLEHFDDREWEIVRTFENRWNLIARYPKLSEQILGIDTKSHLHKEGYRLWSYNNMKDSDLIPVFEFYHKRTDALPSGRYCKFVSDDAILYDGPMPYKNLPVDRIVPGEIFDTIEGYTDMFDLIPLQEALNVLVSSGFTNLQAFGIQGVLIPRLSNLSVEQISKAMVGLKYDPQGGEPKPLQLTAMPQGLFEMAGLLKQGMETISGMNSVARGDPESSLKSGVALALVQSMAVQYASAFQESWASLLEDSGTKIFELLQAFAKTERMAEMSGKSNKGRLLSFKSEDLSELTRVQIELGNPLTRTTSGKAQIAEHLMDKGLIKTPQQFFEVIETGNLETMTEGPSSQLELVRQENEFMMEGKAVRALVSDSHLLHMQEHAVILDNPLMRDLENPENQKILEAALSHIQMHMELYQNQDPMWSVIRGEPPSPQPQPMEQEMPPQAGPIGAQEAMPPVSQPPPEPKLPPGPERATPIMDRPILQ